MAVRQLPDLSAKEWAVLGAVAEGPTHGFAVARLLADDGPLGQVWTVTRPDVYQSVRKLVRLGLVKPGDTEPGNRGPARTVLVATASGRRLLQRWLSEPVDHVRDVRSLLLLKLAMLDRLGLDAGSLIEAQRSLLAPRVESLATSLAKAEGFERVLAEWRLTSYRATVDFLDAIHQPARDASKQRRAGNRSARR